MACRMLMTPTLPDAAEAAEAGDCAQAAPVLNMHAAVRAAVRFNIFRDRKAVNVFGDRKAVNNLEFTFLSLLWPATENRGEPVPSQLGLKLIPHPADFASLS